MLVRLFSDHHNPNDNPHLTFGTPHSPLLLCCPPLHTLPSTMIFFMSYLLCLPPLEHKVPLDRGFGLFSSLKYLLAPE